MNKELALLILPLALAANAQPSSCSSDGVPAPRALLERFINADCATCWGAKQTPDAASGTLAIDWVTPGAKGDAPEDIPSVQLYQPPADKASGAVRLCRPNYLHYIATKAALGGMSLSMARELGAGGITVNAILPGATFTEIERKTVTPEQKERIISLQCIPRTEGLDDLVGTALFLASDLASNITGVNLPVDGGASAGHGTRAA